MLGKEATFIYAEGSSAVTNNATITSGTNGKIIAIKNQDDDKSAVSEIVKAWVANVDKFQAALAKKKTPLPKGVKSTRKKIIETLKTEIAELDALIAEREMQIQAA